MKLDTVVSLLGIALIFSALSIIEIKVKIKKLEEKIEQAPEEVIK